MRDGHIEILPDPSLPNYLGISAFSLTNHHKVTDKSHKREIPTSTAGLIEPPPHPA